MRASNPLSKGLFEGADESVSAGPDKGRFGDDLRDGRINVRLEGLILRLKIDERN